MSKFSFAKAYFDLVYVPIYDATTGRLSCYQKLQQTCIDKLDLQENDRVLCVGVGTANEIILMLKKQANLWITGIDYSAPSIDKAREKLYEYNAETTDRIYLFVNDAQNIIYGDDAFDKVFCVCVLTFVRNRHKAVKEIVRVLKHKGHMVVTFPVDKRAIGDVFTKQFKDSMNTTNKLGGLLRFLLVSFLYIPLLFSHRDKPESIGNIIKYLTALGIENIKTEVDPVYGLIIVSGDKI